MRKRKPTQNPPTPEAAPRPPPTWTRFPPRPPSAFALANLDRPEREHRRDQHSLDQRAWEREQAQERRAWEREQEALMREREAQAREEELNRILAQIQAKTSAASRVAKRAIAGDRGLVQANAKTLAELKAVQRDLAAKGGPKPTKRGPKGYSPEVKELVLAEAERMRSAGKRVTALALLNRPAVKKLCEKLGHNSLPSTRAVSRWVSLKRP
jgi:hypothetical protein